MTSPLTHFTCPIRTLPRAVLFDYDGVLVASEPIHLSAWMQLLAEMNLPATQADIGHHIGRTAPEILTHLLDTYRKGWTAAEYDIPTLTQRKNTIYLTMSQTRLNTYPGVEEGVRWLRSKNVKMAVVSNGRRREVEKTMRQLELWDFMEQIVCRDDVPAFKPDPTPYRFASACLEIETHECLAIEDSPTGLQSALLAQIPAAAVMTNFPRTILEKPVPGRPDLNPVWIGPSIQEFFNWLKTLEA